MGQEKSVFPEDESNEKDEVQEGFWRGRKLSKQTNENNKNPLPLNHSRVGKGLR